ncbi:MAG: hypothetical protein EA397_00070 [Deltaproteobacteria bacterium]|nr:MAG: hypothetical protein EA397_00070 [Deltaproteobacteria bacterium]
MSTSRKSSSSSEPSTALVPPQHYGFAGTLIAVSGCINLLIGAVVILGVVFVAGPCCCLGFLPLIYGGLEIWAGRRMIAGQPVSGLKWISLGGLIVGAMTLPLGGFLPVGLELLASFSLRDPEVETFLASELPGWSPLD